MNIPSEHYEEREQSRIKHFVLGKYLAAASRILGPTREFRYVDCCAGPWNSRNPDFSDTSFGIALAELRKSREHLLGRKLSSRFECLLIEKRRSSFAQLARFVDNNKVEGIGVEARNWDFSAHTDDIVRFASKRGAFPFVFVDPTGWKLAGIPSISDLLRLNPGEVLINFMSSFVTRFVKSGVTSFRDLLGGDLRELDGLTGSELEFAVVQLYCSRIREIGKFEYVCALPIMKPKVEAIHFYLIYATRHLKGVQVFKQVEKQTETMTRVVRADVQQRHRQARTGNLDLFSADEYYREDRYREIVDSNKRRAEKAVSALMSTGSEIPYDDCWAEALQYAGVYEQDVRSFLLQLEGRGLVQISGRRFESEVLKLNSGVVVRPQSGMAASQS